eukprot:1294790-Prymnesium_polylepis.1
MQSRCQPADVLTAPPSVGPFVVRTSSAQCPSEVCVTFPARHRRVTPQVRTHWLLCDAAAPRAFSNADDR